ncbi:curlin subunit CsgB, partial [Halomonas sp. AOP43-D1-39]
MKTQITTIAAAVAFAMSTAASAQYWSAGSDSTIYQSGNSNTNDITQWGTQTSRVYQEGNSNSTTVSQDDISGVATTLPGRNKTGIDQIGQSNTADVTQL